MLPHQGVIQNTDTQTIRKMIKYDITQDVRFKQGVETGKETTKRAVIEKVLKRNVLSASQIAEDFEVSIDQVREIEKELQTR